MKSLFNLALLISILAAVLVTFVSASAIEASMPIALIILTVLSRKDDNCLLLTACFATVFLLSAIVMYVLKVVIFPAVESNYIQNIYAFMSSLSLSIFLLYLIKHRMTVGVLVTKGKSPTVFERNHAEGPLYFLVITMVTVDFMALTENFIRNLEHLGVTEETAKVFWEVTFFYDYFEYLKAVPMLLCVLMLYVGLIVRTKNHQLQS
ncbi:hypothetical protein [Pseudoalteromonas 'SMAR']|uniref:hypothetical protein n=1 Tax=Pseudoalteromonas 'SMAR' TaxID=3416908 RepID=UPI003AF2E5DB